MGPLYKTLARLGRSCLKKEGSASGPGPALKAGDTSRTGFPAARALQLSQLIGQMSPKFSVHGEHGLVPFAHALRCIEEALRHEAAVEKSVRVVDPVQLVIRLRRLGGLRLLVLGLRLLALGLRLVLGLVFTILLVLLRWLLPILCLFLLAAQPSSVARALEAWVLLPFRVEVVFPMVS